MHVFRTQKHMRFHFLTVVLVVVVGLLLRLSAAEMAVLFLVVSAVLITEMLNTAIESVVDMITQAYHPLAKLAKDIAAGAVLIAAINATIVGAILFFGDHKFERLQAGVDHGPKTAMVFITVPLLLLVLVLISKVLGGKGSILSGGVVSGHAAISFCLAATIIYRANDIIAAVLALALAFLVAQSRVEGKIHTMQEVVIGGLLGTCVPGFFYFLQIFHR